jgi:hypothetical protein
MRAADGDPGARLANQLLRLLCSTAERRRRCQPQLADLASRVAPEALALAAARQRLLGLAISRLQESGQPGIARLLCERGRAHLQRCERRSLTQYALTAAICSTLEQAGVAAVPLKGPLLAECLYGDPALRESNDIDLLVAPEDLERAVLLTSRHLGYEPPADAVREDGRPLLHYHLPHRQGAPAVELHWRLHWYESRSGAAMVKRSSQAGAVRRLAPADELSSLLLFYARDGFAGLAPLAAIAAWWDRFGDRLPPGGLSDFAAEFPELAPALIAGGRIAAALVGLPLGTCWPASGAARLRGEPTRLANWRLSGSCEQLSAHAALVDLMLSPRPKRIGRWLRRQLILPRAELLRRASVGARSWPLAAGARHAASTLARLLLDVGSIRMAPPC